MAQPTTLTTLSTSETLQALAGAAAMYGVQHEVTLMGRGPQQQADPPWVNYIRQQASRIPELNSLVDRRGQAAGSEDATYMMERVKEFGGHASYIIFGTDLSAGHHNEKFDFNEQVMAMAVKTLARTGAQYSVTSERTRNVCRIQRLCRALYR